MTMTMTDLAAAKRRLAGTPRNVLCAVSGGLDSMCLLHLLSVWGRQQGMVVTAAHFNHRLRQTADRDETFVRQICAGWGIPLLCGSGDVRALAAETGKSLEEAGREARYAFLEQARRESGSTVILTAHHADDNAETLLLNLLRGTGLQGLTGIPAERDAVLRPFLDVTRAELAEYAEKHGLPHVEDETNELDDAARNALRHKVLPVLRELNPRAVENMNRTAALLKRDARALEIAAGTLLREARVIPGERAELPVSACETQPEAVVSRAVLSLMVSVGGHRKDLTAAHVESVLELRRSGEGKIVSLPYGLTACREKHTIKIEKTAPVPEAIPVSLGETVDFGGWSVTLRETAGEGLCYAVPAVENLTVTVWRPSDRMTLAGSRGSRSVKRLCAERGLTPAERDGLPVLRAGETPVAVPWVGVNLDVTPQSDAVIYVTFTKHKERDYEK